MYFGSKGTTENQTLKYTYFW